jgi:tripartite-type tricarboxylate transporter receptor subunit TctC
MTTSKRLWLRRTGILGMGVALGLNAWSQTFPSRPIRLVVPYAAGGPTDQHVRAVADEAGKILKQGITIDNRPGANGSLGAAAMSSATPDGYTLAIVPSVIFREPHMTKVSYDPLTSFSYITLLSSYAFGFAVKADAPWKNWQEFAADAAKRPRMINAGATGAVGTPRIGLEEAAEAARIELNSAPFKSDVDVTNALLGGHIDAAVLTGVAMPHIEAGKMRYLAMMTERRVKRFPDLPTLKELGVDVWVDSSYGLVGPRGMEPAVIRQIHEAFKAALESPASVKVMDQLNQSSSYKGPEDFRQYAVQSFHIERTRVEKLRQRGLLK